MSLYKELDNTQTEEGLDAFREKLIDRFGPIPKQTQELINTIHLRWLAKKIGFEKLILKNRRMTGHFVSNQESPYYQSETFGKVLKFVQQNPTICRMREKNNKLTLAFDEITKIDLAIEKLNPVINVAGNQVV